MEKKGGSEWKITAANFIPICRGAVGRRRQSAVCMWAHIHVDDKKNDLKRGGGNIIWIIKKAPFEFIILGDKDKIVCVT